MRLTREEWRRLRDSGDPDTCEEYPYDCKHLLEFTEFATGLDCRCVRERMSAAPDAEKAIDPTCQRCGRSLEEDICLACY